MPRAEAVRQAIHLMADAQAMLDGAGADIAAAHLEFAMHCAERFLSELLRGDQPPK